MKSDAYWHDVGDADALADKAAAAEAFRKKYLAIVQFAFGNLESQKCRCGERKRQRQSVCRSCYGKLPAELQRSLYQERERYPKQYLRALHHLGMIGVTQFERGIAILDGRNPRQVE